MDEFAGVSERNLFAIEDKRITSSSLQLERSRKKSRLDNAEVEDTKVKVNLNSSFPLRRPGMKYYHYHKGNCHETNKCNSLKDDIEELIHKANLLSTLRRNKGESDLVHLERGRT